MLSTLTAGALMSAPQDTGSLLSFWRYGVSFSVTVMSILLAHEMGHYVTARAYGVRATLPFFIPFPSLIGTLGAFIMIRSPFPNRRSLLDIGLAGPFAGFVVTVPALVIGIMQSHVGAPSESGMTLGEPLLFRWVSAVLWPNLRSDEVLYVSPVGFAAWFGLLATAINLMPIGQLDGGHASYALFRQGAHRISRVAFFLLFPLAYFGPNWLIWAALAYVLGVRRRHPPTLDDGEPLSFGRKIVGVLGYATFLICFTPEPVEFRWTEIYHEIFGP